MTDEGLTLNYILNYAIVRKGKFWMINENLTLVRENSSIPSEISRDKIIFKSF